MLNGFKFATYFSYPKSMSFCLSILQWAFLFQHQIKFLLNQHILDLPQLLLLLFSPQQTNSLFLMEEALEEYEDVEVTKSQKFKQFHQCMHKQCLFLRDAYQEPCWLLCSSIFLFSYFRLSHKVIHLRLKRILSYLYNLFHKTKEL